MSDSESGEDNFEDAVESVEVSVSPASRAKRNTMKRGAVPGPAAEKQLSPEIEDQIEILTGDQLAERDTRWRRLEQLRMRRATGDNTAGTGAGQESPGQESPLNVTASTPADSRESSVEGIYLSGVRSHHPFKVVECDTRSVASDGKSVRTGDSHRSSVSDVRPCAAPPPDIVSSVVRQAPAPAPAKPAPVPSSPVTPAPSAVMGPPSQPLAPPRKKKVSTSSSASPGPDTADPVPAPKISASVGTKPKPTSLAVESLAVPHPIPSPASTVASLTKDLESQLLKSPGSAQDDRLSLHNLNISSATRGDFVVRPQDEESRRGEQERKVSASEAPDINQDPSGGAAAAGDEEEALADAAPYRRAPGSKFSAV